MNELFHHGINGQKWGVQNGPPYPLNKYSKSLSQIKLADIEKGKKIVDSLLKMDLQFFAKKSEFRWRNKEEKARVMSVFDSLLPPEKYEDVVMKDIQSYDGSGGGAFTYTGVNQDGYGNFKIVNRTRISDSATGLEVRNK